MTANTILLNNAPALVAALAPSPGETVMDVGGGQGQVLLRLLEAYPGIRGVLPGAGARCCPGVDEQLREGGALAGRAPAN